MFDIIKNFVIIIIVNLLPFTICLFTENQSKEELRSTSW